MLQGQQISMSGFPSVVRWLSAVCLVSSLIGCGGPERPPMGYVSGIVTLDGEPLKEVTVVMKPEKGRAAMALTDASGHYDIEYTRGEKGTKIGPTSVSFEWYPGHANPKPIPKSAASGTSELKLDVKAGKQTENFDLTSDASVPQRTGPVPD